MEKFISLGSFFVVTLIVISCQSTGNEQSKPDLKEILPNTTWYSLVPDSNEIYTKSKFGNLNTDIVYSIHNFPCGSTPNDTFNWNYTIFEKNKLRLEFIPFTSEHKVISHSEGKIVMKNAHDDYQATLRSDCSDLK